MKPTDGRFWSAYRKRQATEPTGCTSSIRTAIAAAAKAGKAGKAAPTDPELAALFAISVDRVRHHRRLLGM